MIALTEIRCLVAQGAHYHSSCRKSYTRSEERHTKSETVNQYTEFQEAHNQAFEFIVNHVQKELIGNHNVERLSMLKEKYQTYMQTHFQQHYNPNYRDQKLKEKLENRFYEQIVFWSQNQSPTLVFLSSVETGEAVETAFGESVSDKRELKDAAILLRRVILQSFNDTAEIPWPPCHICSSSSLQICYTQSQTLINHFNMKDQSCLFAKLLSTMYAKANGYYQNNFFLA